MRGREGEERREREKKERKEKKRKEKKRKEKKRKEKKPDRIEGPSTFSFVTATACLSTSL